jgi:hypothetical protein
MLKEKVSISGSFRKYWVNVKIILNFNKTARSHKAKDLLRNMVKLLVLASFILSSSAEKIFTRDAIFNREFTRFTS